MIKFRKLLNPLIRLRKKIKSHSKAMELERLSIEKCMTNAPRYDGLIVSLTSIPSRLAIVHLTIRSLFAQTQLPRKIILWLHEDLKKQIPQSLSSLENEIFEIRFNDLSCSHRKLVSSLECFPEDCIVTCDDDCMYEVDWLELLHASHLLFPNEVIGGKCRRIIYDDAGELMPYKRWRHESQRGISEGCLLAVGYAGILYPPHGLMADVTNRELFLNLAPHADDLWFKAMAVLNGTGVRIASASINDPLEINRSQKFALRRENIREDGNHRQWRQICRHYNLTATQVTGVNSISQ